MSSWIWSVAVSNYSTSDINILVSKLWHLNYSWHKIFNSTTNLLKANSNEIQWLFDCIRIWICFELISVIFFFYVLLLSLFPCCSCITFVLLCIFSPWPTSHLWTVLLLFLCVCLQLILFFCDYQPLASCSIYDSALSQTNGQTYGCQHWAKSEDRDSFFG